MKKTNPQARHAAREKLVQALYQWQIASSDLVEIEMQFHADNDMEKIDIDYFHELLHAIPQQVSQLDDTFTPLLDRELAEIDPVELAILRLATYEMKERLDIPFRVVINEAVELAKTFGAEASHKYINGVMDKMARQVRDNK